MITDLPYTLSVDGVQRKINADFRDVINILCAYNDPELDAEIRTYILLNNLYAEDFTEFEDIDEAIKQAVWFIDCGKEYSKAESTPRRLMDWEQDYNIIISAVNKSANVLDVRDLPFLHWWTFMGYLEERGECTFSYVVEIRDKMFKGKNLEKYEREFLNTNREQVILQDKYSEDEQRQINEIFGE